MNEDCICVVFICVCVYLPYFVFKFPFCVRKLRGGMLRQVLEFRTRVYFLAVIYLIFVFDI